MLTTRFDTVVPNPAYVGVGSGAQLVSHSTR